MKRRRKQVLIFVSLLTTIRKKLRAWKFLYALPVPLNNQPKKSDLGTQQGLQKYCKATAYDALRQI